MSEVSSASGAAPPPEPQPMEATGDHTAEFTAAPFCLDFAAVSDVGRVRKNNQDSGYAGPWLLSVCDGVGGAVGGDIASATAIGAIRTLDHQPVGDLLGQVEAALIEAHQQIGALVEARPALAGTSTTAVVALFDGHQLAFGHIGDSRAYLLRGGLIKQLTHDHTFVQTLIDEGRITEEDAKTHPHRNLILRALDSAHDVDPDLFLVDLAIGDRVLVCSDGASGVLDEARLTDILSGGSADFAATELVRASLEAGSTDNVTCVVADVLPIDVTTPPRSRPAQVVGSAAHEPTHAAIDTGERRRSFLGHRSGDTGELPAVSAPAIKTKAPGRGRGRAPELPDLPADIGYAIPSDPLDVEAARYAPRPPRRFIWLRRALATLMAFGAIWIVGAAAYSWSQQQFFVGVDGDQVVVYRGVNYALPGFDLKTVYESTDLTLDRLAEFDADRVRAGIATPSLDVARVTIDGLAKEARPSEPTTAGG